MTVAVALGLSLLLAAPPRGPTAVQALPVVARLSVPQGTPLVLRGQLSPERARKLSSVAAAVQRDVARRFLSERDHGGQPPVQLCLFETQRAYRDFVDALLEGAPAPSELGFYDPVQRVVVANVGLSIGNLRHELAHALVGDDFPGIPSWLNEGVGALYGTAIEQPRGFAFVANYRLRHLRAARAAGELPSLGELSRSTAGEVYGDRAPVYYGLSRHLLLYLDRRGTLRTCFERLRAAPDADARHRELERCVDFPRFLAWTDQLTIGR